MSNKLTLILVRYLQVRNGNEDDYLFCNKKGLRADKRTVQQQIADFNLGRGVQRTSCHSFRHTFARMYLVNGGDAFRLQKILGHSDLTMTKKYVALFAQDLKKDFDKLCPI